MVEILLPTALAGYVFGVVLAAVGTAKQSRTIHAFASVVFVATWVVHLVTIVKIAVDAGRIPLTNVFEYLLVFGWVVLGLYLYIGLRRRVPVAGLVLPPISALSTAVALALYEPSVPEIVGPSIWFLFHTTISTLGVAILGVAFAMALLYLGQDFALKSHRAPALLHRLPSLQKCDRVGLESLIVGFILLTLGIGTGVILNSSRHSEFLSGGVKQVLPLLAWAVFFAVLLARTWLGYRGRKSAILTIAGFLLALASAAGMTL
jgi:ABC-type uncharacterized transport system permease subunit